MSRHRVRALSLAASPIVEQLESRRLRAASLVNGQLSVGPDAATGDDVISLIK